MGILDDAIREHLDLKRRLGAEDSELARLEDEAFGPPSRPGDPDFPEQGRTGETLATEPATGEVATQTVPPPTEPPASEPVAPGASDSPAQPPPEPPSVSEPAAEQAAAAAPPSEPAAAPEAPPAPSEPAPTGEQPAAGSFYDHEGDELDLELELDDEPPAAAEPPSEDFAAVAEPPSEELAAPETADQPAVDPAPTPPPASEPPIESLDTVEHHFEGALGTGETDVVEPPLDTVEAAVVEGPIEDTGEAEVVEGELTDEEEDVLEETPEFLRDQPEDDELWFEQGEPKDFDF